MPNDTPNTPNGNDNLHQRVSALEKAQDDIDRLSLKMLRLLEQQQEYLEGHDKRMEEIERQAAADRERVRAFDERVDKLVSGIGELIRRPPAPPAA